MDYLYIASHGLVVPISPFRRIRLLEISNILPQISLLNEVNYLFFQLKTIFSVVPVISMELTVLVIVSFAGIGFDFSRPLDEFFMLDLREHLGDGSIERWQNQLRATRWSVRASITGFSFRIKIWPHVPHLFPMISSPEIRFFSLIVVSSPPHSFGLG